jgi:hypothetical protein
MKRIVTPGESAGLVVHKASGLPSGYVKSLLLKMAIEIVSFPIKNGDFP